MLDKFRNIITLSLLCLIAISYHVVFSPVDAVKTILSPQILFLTVLTFIVTFNKDFFSFKYLKLIFFVLILVGINGVICDCYFYDKRYYSDLRDIIIPFAALCIGYNIKISDKFFLWLLFLYGGILIFYSSISQISTNIGGLVITDDYKIPSKNAIGAMLSSFIAASLPVLLAENYKRIIRFFLGFLLLSAFVVLVTIRARASTMTGFFAILIYVILVLKNMKNGYNKAGRAIITIGIAALVIASVSSVLFQTVGDYIYNSLFQNVEGDVTTGRMERNTIALNYLTDHLLLGSLDTGTRLPWVHNYFLRVLTDYGLLFSFPLLLLYVFFLIKIILRFFSSNILSYHTTGYWAVLTLLMLSFVEPLFPFSPGTAVFFSFVLLGYSLKQHSIRNAF